MLETQDKYTYDLDHITDDIKISTIFFFDATETFLKGCNFPPRKMNKID